MLGLFEDLLEGVFYGVLVLAGAVLVEDVLGALGLLLEVVGLVVGVLLDFGFDGLGEVEEIAVGDEGAAGVVLHVFLAGVAGVADDVAAAGEGFCGGEAEAFAVGEGEEEIGFLKFLGDGFGGEVVDGCELEVLEFTALLEEVDDCGAIAGEAAWHVGDTFLFVGAEVEDLWVDGVGDAVDGLRDLEGCECVVNELGDAEPGADVGVVEWVVLGGGVAELAFGEEDVGVLVVDDFGDAGKDVWDVADAVFG